MCVRAYVRVVGCAWCKWSGGLRACVRVQRACVRVCVCACECVTETDGQSLHLTLVSAYLSHFDELRV